MKIILSPAKKLKEEISNYSGECSVPNFLDDSQELIKTLKKLSKNDILDLMKISSKLSELNYNRYQNWKKEDIELGKASVFMFDGEAYRGLDINSFSENELKILNNKLVILSGLYGLLKPLDKILPYRLEMGTKLKNIKGKNLYDFWKERLTENLNVILNKEPLINLASKEYSSVIDFKKLDSPVIQVDFLQEKDNKFKNIAIYSKKARGMMTAFIVKNNLTDLNDLKAFESEKYYFNNMLSKENHFVFCR